MKKICNECTSEISYNAKVCPKCSTRIVGIECGKCKSICKNGAMLCKWCMNFLTSKHDEELNFESFDIISEFIPTLLLGGSFLSQITAFSKQKIVITTPYFFGFASKIEEVMWNNVTGFQHHAGIIWDSITIETKGQTTNQINFLSKKNAKKIAEILRKLQT